MDELTTSRDGQSTDALAHLRQHEHELCRLGVGSLWLLGSIARDEAERDSDVDLSFDPGSDGLTLLDLMAIEDRIAAITGRRADVMTRPSLHPRLAPAIQAGALRVF